MVRIFILLFLFFAILTSAWAAYPNYTICPSGCDYSVLNSAFTDITTNHSNLSNNVTITISGSWSSPDTTAATLGTYTPGAHTVLVTAIGTARATGVYQATGAYTLAPASGIPLTIQNNNDTNNHLTIDGLQIVSPGGTGKGPIYIANYNGGDNVTNNLLIPGSSDNGCIYWVSPRDINYTYNNVCYGLTAQYASFFGLLGGYMGSGDGSTYFYIYNNTLYGSTGANADGIATIPGGVAFVASNNIILNCGNACYAIDEGGSFTSGTDNASSDSTATLSPLTGGLTGKTSYTSYFFSVSGNNFSLIVGSVFNNAGTNLYGTFTTDITGKTRPASGNWDIGAFIAAPKSKGIAVNGGITVNGSLTVQ